MSAVLALIVVALLVIFAGIGLSEVLDADFAVVTSHVAMVVMAAASLPLVAMDQPPDRRVTEADAELSRERSEAASKGSSHTPRSPVGGRAPSGPRRDGDQEGLS